MGTTPAAARHRGLCRAREPMMSEPTIQIDDQGVRRHLADGKLEQVRWDELTEVWIVTSAEGPFAEDVFFVLTGDGDTGCVVPQGAAESGALLERLQRLPGFDNEAVIQAMACAEDARFVCWRRAGPP